MGKERNKQEQNPPRSTKELLRDLHPKITDCYDICRHLLEGQALLIDPISDDAQRKEVELLRRTIERMEAILKDEDRG